jgi:hypothetical protein
VTLYYHACPQVETARPGGNRPAWQSVEAFLAADANEVEVVTALKLPPVGSAERFWSFKARKKHSRCAPLLDPAEPCKALRSPAKSCLPLRSPAKPCEALRSPAESCKAQALHGISRGAPACTARHYVSSSSDKVR